MNCRRITATRNKEKSVEQGRSSQQKLDSRGDVNNQQQQQQFITQVHVI